MRKTLFAFLSAGLLVSCIGQSIIRGSGIAAKGDFDINPNWTALSVSNGIKVILDPTLGNTGEIVADDNILEYVDITEKNGKITVRYTPPISISAKLQTVVTLPASPAITSLRASSSASIEAEERIFARSLKISVSSSAKIRAGVEARELAIDFSSSGRCYVDGDCGTVKISGSSSGNFEGNFTAREFYGDISSSAKCTVQGKADYAKVKTNSSGRFDGYDFICAKADAGANSSGSVRITVADELEANASSAGSIRYRGTPRVTSFDASSAGSIKRED